MGFWANFIYNLTNTNIITGRKNKAADVRLVLAGVADAIAFLEGLAAGAKTLHGPAAPDGADGANGDAYLNTTTSDFYFKEDDDWALAVNLKGLPGLNGRNGRDGRTPVLGVDYTVTNGTNGASAFQVWLDAGNTGNVGAFLASLNGTDGTNGNRFTASTAAPVTSEVILVGVPLETSEVITRDIFAGRTVGDLHFQILSADRYRVWYLDGGGWVAIYTTPASALIADGSVTNVKLADDVKVGSLSGARNAYPAGDRAGLTTVETFLVWIGPKVTDLFTRVGQLDTGFGTLSGLVNGFAARITALEARPVGGTGTGTGTGSANFPAQSTTTTNQFLQSSGTAGGERWASVTINRRAYLLNAKNETSRNQRFFKAHTITEITIDAGVSTLSYSINGATAVSIVFTNGVFTPSAALVFPANSLVTWTLTYAANFTEAFFVVEGTI